MEIVWRIGWEIISHGELSGAECKSYRELSDKAYLMQDHVRQNEDLTENRLTNHTSSGAISGKVQISQRVG